MGTIAARDCVRIIELTEQVAAALLIAVVQGVELRGGQSDFSAGLKNTMRQVRAKIGFLDADRALERELRLCLQLIRDRHWVLYD